MDLKPFNTQITVCGNSYLEIENCRRIMEYNDIYLKVRLYPSGELVEIWGTNLRLSDYNTDGISVRGRIASIELHGTEDEVE